MAEARVEEVGRRTFQIDACLGRGGFGEVYRALMSSPGGLQSEVAVKVLRGDLDPAGQAVQRLRDEGRLLARLDHPTILRVHDLVVLDGRIALVTEFIDGQDLGELCHGDDAIPVRALLEVIGAVAGALDAAWSSPLAPGGAPLQIVHRDIKPSNIRVSRHGQVKLLDFGIARTDTVDREAKTQTNLMVGSPAYMAPERFTTNEVLPASDVFALGCALYEGLARGDRLLGDLSLPMLSALGLDEDRYATHVRRKLAPVRRKHSEPVVALLEAMLTWDPARRPTAAEVQHRCEEVAEDAPGRSLARWCRERTWARGAVEQGVLDGRVLSEGTLARSREIVPIGSADAITERGMASLPPSQSDDPRDTDRPRRLALWFAIVGGAAALVATLGVGGAAVGLWAWGGLGGAEPLAVTEPVAVAGPASDAQPAEAHADGEVVADPGAVAEVGAGLEPPPTPTPDPVAPAPGAARVAPEPASVAPGPAPVAPGPAPVVPEPAQVAPEPAQVAPEPAPVPSVAPSTPTIARAHVEQVGSIALRLRQGAREVDPPADVAPGTWELWGKFNGRDWSPGGEITLEAGGSYAIRCSTGMLRCQPAER